jgi:hypothetical protein
MIIQSYVQIPADILSYNLADVSVLCIWPMYLAYVFGLCIWPMYLANPSKLF